MQSVYMKMKCKKNPGDIYMYVLGFDIGSSSVKATLLDIDTGVAVATAVSPETELDIIAHKPGWAEQHPQVWWEHTKAVTASIMSDTGIDKRDVKRFNDSNVHGIVGKGIQNMNIV